MTDGMSGDPRSVMRCLRMRSTVVDAVESFHFRRDKGRNMSRIHSATVHVRLRGSWLKCLCNCAQQVCSKRATLLV